MVWILGYLSSAEKMPGPETVLTHIWVMRDQTVSFSVASALGDTPLS